MGLMTILYIAGRLNTFHDALCILIFFVGFFGLLSIGYMYLWNIEECTPTNTKNLNKLVCLLIILFAIRVIIPSERGLYILLGTHYLKDAEIPNKIIKIIDKKLDSIIEGDEKDNRK